MPARRSAQSVVLCLAILVASAHAAPQPAGDGLIRQGPYLLCGDDEAMVSLLYEGRPFIHGMGIYCGLNGYTVPRDLQNQEVVREPGKVIYRGKVRGHDVAFEQTLDIAGDRIRIAIRRIGAWPGDEWGSFHIRLPVSGYGGASYLADGNANALPVDYSPDHQFPGGLSRLELQTGEPRLNVIFESEAGIGIGDHRRFSAPYYIVSVGVPRGEDDTVELFITLPDVESPPRRAVRWSRIGYPLAGEKLVMLEWDKGAPRPDDWARLERRDEGVVKEGVFGETQAVDHIQGQYAAFAFTEMREPGDYRVAWSGGETDWFPVRANVFTDGLWRPTLDYFIPFEMCHAAVALGADVTGHPECHRDDGVRVAANHGGPDGFVSYEAEGTPYAAGEQIGCAEGGWHDAGDYDLNVPAQGYVTWVLALAYEEFGLDRDVATLNVRTRTFSQGTPDGVPDVVQQIEWGARWLLSMQQEGGRVYNGICAEDAQRPGELGKVTDGDPGTGDERRVYVDYHADCQLNFAIAMAAASRALAKHRPDLARLCRTAAVVAFDYFQDHDEVYRRGSYTASDVKGKERDASVIAAAVELYLTTRDEQYVAVIEGLTPSLAELKLDWPLPRQTGVGGFRYLPPFLARIYPELAEGDAKVAVLATCRRAAQKKADQTGVRPWPFLWYHFGQWGNTSTSTQRAFDTYWLSKVAPDVLPPESVLRNMLWVFGLHPAGDTTFVTGLGHPEPQHLYSSHLHALYGTAPSSVPGAVVPGMGGFWNSGVIAYIDEHGYYGSNEACIYTAADYIFAVNAMKAMGF